MKYQDKVKNDKQTYENLRIDCEKCFGLCCVALYFSAAEGFPTDKAAGKPCINLQNDFKCSVHDTLREKGLKGCISYDCFGAGQKVAQVTYHGKNWMGNSDLAKQMFEAFLIMRQLHEMLWYLIEAFVIETNDPTIRDQLCYLISKIESFTYLDAHSLIALDIEAHRKDVNSLLRKVSELVRINALKGQKPTINYKKTIAGRLDLIGADLRKANLRGADLRGAFLIGANLRGVDLSGADFIGADLRDVDFRGTNLEKSIFITQAQINTTKGDSNTRLPMSLIRPVHWNQ